MILIQDNTPEISSNDRHYLINLANFTTLDERQKKYLLFGIHQCDNIEDYENIERYLLLNVIENKDRISMGFSYNANDIKEALKQL